MTKLLLEDFLKVCLGNLIENSLTKPMKAGVWLKFLTADVATVKYWTKKVIMRKTLTHLIHDSDTYYISNWQYSGISELTKNVMKK